MHSEAKKTKFIELRAEGLSFDNIAKQIKVSKPTLISWSRQLARDISNYKAVQVDALRQEFLVTKEAKVRRLSKILDKISKEIEKRDFSDLPTVKLLEMETQIISEIDKELKVTFEDLVDSLEAMTFGHETSWDA